MQTQTINRKTIELTPMQMEAHRHQAAVADAISRRFFGGIDLDEMERQALLKHPPGQYREQHPDASPYIKGIPVDPAISKIAVDLAKQNLPKKEPKRSRKTLP